MARSRAAAEQCQLDEALGEEMRLAGFRRSLSARVRQLDRAGLEFLRLELQRAADSRGLGRVTVRVQSEKRAAALANSKARPRERQAPGLVNRRPSASAGAKPDAKVRRKNSVERVHRRP